MPRKASWFERLGRRIARWPSGAWVVAVSGGGDSVGLLRVLHAMAPTSGLRLSVAHLDHGTRGEASLADAAFVAELAGTLDLPFDLGQWRPTRAGHFESDARTARLDWLVEVAGRRGARVIALGHTRDDQAETILHRILRGTGPRGLSGIPGCRRLGDDPPIDLIRPLLGVSREQVRDYLRSIGQPWRDDASNDDRARTRARIRHELLPALARDYNPDVVGALVRLGGLARSSGRALEAELRRLEDRAVIERTDDRLVLDRGPIRGAPRFLRAELIRGCWRRAGWPERGMSTRRWRRLARLAVVGERRGVAIGAGVSASAVGDSLILSRPSAPVEAAVIEPVPLDVPGAADLPWAGGRVVVGTDESEPGDEVVDRGRLFLPLVVRSPRPGDRFEPLGMGGRGMPLADFFRGAGVPRDRRASTPLVCDRGGIVWVVGHRIADRVKRTERTRECLVMGWRPDATGGD